jgi:hypothetical protein
MGETIARIGHDGKVELVDEKMTKIAGVAPMSPTDAAFLARSLLSCAALLSLGRITTDRHTMRGLAFPRLEMDDHSADRDAPPGCYIFCSARNRPNLSIVLASRETAWGGSRCPL